MAGHSVVAGHLLPQFGQLVGILHAARRAAVASWSKVDEAASGGRHEEGGWREEGRG